MTLIPSPISRRRLIVGLASALLLAAPAAAQQSLPAPSPAPIRCEADSCRSDDGLLLRIGDDDAPAPPQPGRTDLPVAGTVPASPAVTPDVAARGGQFMAELPNGGVVWATEDPTMVPPSLSVQAAATVPFENGRVIRPLRFHSYNNYASFIQKLEVTLYRGTDTDLVTPLARVELPADYVGDAEWSGELPPQIKLRTGDDLIYVARAYGAGGAFDETRLQRIQLVTPADFDRGLQITRENVQKTLGQALDGDSAQDLQLSNSIYGQSMLRLQNIPIHGSRVRLYGRNLEPNSRVRINGQDFPVDLEQKFAAEFLEPVGEHRYEVSVESRDAPSAQRQLDVDVTGRYLFLVAIADVTVSRNSASGNLQPLAADDRDDDSFLSEGRLAFYLKGKLRGKYLVTAQADTQDRELKYLFRDFTQADAQDVFRRLDPDLYYPVYGDDSTTYRDVDTQGRLYLRVDWDQSQAVWGNYATGITGTEYGQYVRSLYGGALNWRSLEATPLGEARSQVKVFGSEAQSAPGHSEFLGTGGSLYYLRHTDVLPGSEQVVLEVRDRTTGRTETRATLQEGVDYEIDNLQGRLILTRPLAQLTRENVRSITRDMPLDGYDQLLLVDYEYVPLGFSSDDVTYGARGRQWIGDHVAIGGTWIDENRSGENYSLKGADLTLQAGRGTYLKMEQTRTEATAAPVFYSDNGGLSFIRRNPYEGRRSGTASAVEARANLRELGWTTQDWSLGAWWRDVDAGFSVARQDTGLPIQEYGAEFLGYITDDFSLYGRHTRTEQGELALEQSQLTAEWRLGNDGQLTGELRRVREEQELQSVDALLAAIGYRQRFGASWELYGTGQVTLDDDGGAYEKNDLLTLGARYLFGDRSSVGAEVSGGSRGHGAKVDGEYRMAPDHSLYGSYSYSTDRTGTDPLFDTGLQSGWTLGQRWRLSNQVNVYNESQYLKDRRQDSAGIVHTFGMDFYPAQGWNLGFTIMDGELDSTLGRVDRRAYSVSGGRTDAVAQWNSKLEYRRDSGAEQREQWVTTNRLLYKLNDDWRFALRANYADTEDRIDRLADAKLVETNMGFAWRPHDNTRWAGFGKFTYLYDVASLGQEGGNLYDQRSQILSLEGIRQLSARWEVAGKLASRWGDYRTGRGEGAWLDSRADFAALQLRYRLFAQWEGLAEHRWLKVRDGGVRKGWLVGVDRRVGENFKVGVGYNFTEFSDDMTELKYDQKGFFLNMAGYY
ncbi:TonB-dependent receptor [Stenotrophomonas sp.]|uniref:TonB-dependent receptor n=1 Tax=Stenotrophomonas sp. TaxID=69392 RepID=UPI0029A44607|nr:TonB-dependent receptor [Stenotrophomonas sp.]MDX3935700.1 TonB-dependent receptor [Stenotrophomonas sp.]